MMILTELRRAFALTVLMSGASAFAQEPVAPGNMAQPTTSPSSAKQAEKPVTPLVPANFNVPVLIKAKDFKLVPLGPELVDVDFRAYMSSIGHLQKTFSRSTNWPRVGISASEAMQDMESEQGRFKSRRSFAYGVLTPDGSRELGSVYVSPSPIEGYDAVVRMWVTKDQFDAGFDARLYGWVTKWIAKDWPFARVAYPGRSIEWGTWDTLVAADKARNATSDKQKL